MFGHALTSFTVTPPIGAIVPYVSKLTKQDNYYVLSGNPAIPIQAWGWMVCDGRAISKKDYPELYNAIGNLYGESDNDFNIPDLQGQFLRGIGTDAASTEGREPAENGEKDDVGSTQKDALQTHIHTYQEASKISVTEQGTGAFGTLIAADTSTPLKSPSTSEEVKVSDIETRATNTFVYFLLKYTSVLSASPVQ